MDSDLTGRKRMLTRARGSWWTTLGMQSGNLKRWHRPLLLQREESTSRRKRRIHRWRAHFLRHCAGSFCQNALAVSVGFEQNKICVFLCIHRLIPVFCHTKKSDKKDTSAP